MHFDSTVWLYTDYIDYYPGTKQALARIKEPKMAAVKFYSFGGKI